MSAHRYHPDPDRDPIPEAKLFDECDRCDEQSVYLGGLDNQNLAWFWSIMDGVKKEGKNLNRHMTDNEWRVVNQMYDMAIVLERLTRVWPSPATLFRFSINAQDWEAT